MVCDLDALDYTIRLFDPDADIALIKNKAYPPRHQAFRGEMARFVLHALRTATAPVTSLEIARAVMKGRGLNLEDTQTTILIRKRVSACLWKLKDKGVIEEVPQVGEYKGWKLVPR